MDTAPIMTPNFRTQTGPSAKSQYKLKMESRGESQAWKRKAEKMFADGEPPLDLWHDRSQALIDNDIIPARLRGVNQHHVSTVQVEMHALVGDKILGAALMEVLVNSGLCVDTGQVTKFYSNVSSNAVFLRYLHDILPARIMEDQINGNMEAHSAGTTIEAAVYKVNGYAGGPQAVEQLAKWLVYKVVFQGTQSGEISNPKGLLLENYGDVDSKRIEGTPDHAPEFIATARWPRENCPAWRPDEPQRVTQAKGTSKKNAEASAALVILKQYEHEIINAPPMQPKEKLELKMENAVGHLYTLGGICESTTEIKDGDGPPLHVAVMRFGQQTASAQATTKKHAMRLAAQQLLEAAGEYDH